MTKGKRPRPLRPIAPAHLVPGPGGASIRTRLRVSETDVKVLEALGRHLGRLANLDLRHALDGVDRTKRKHDLTAACSSRYAGAITAETNRHLRSERTNQRRHRASMARAIDAISDRMKLAPGAGGYPTRAVRYQKQVRREVLRARLAGLGTVSVVRGGHHLWRNRAEIENETARRLAQTEDVTEQQAILDDAANARLAWRTRWDAARLFIRALGSRDELNGNLTIRVDPASGRCSLLLPKDLRHLANDGNGHYLLDAPVLFSYRAQEWRERTDGSAITYTITHRLENKGRWYLDASWSYPSADKTPPEGASIKSKICTPSSLPPAPTVVHGRVLGVDFNADHLAAWVIDASGNPVGKPYRLPLTVKGLSGPTRDGHVRAAVTGLLQIACQQHCEAIVCEDLGWSEETGRDDIGGRVFRHLISGFPTSLFKQRLGSMAARVEIEVVAVDPAYTSQWGQSWQKPTSTSNHETTGHEAAAIVIGRRGQGFRARRRTGVTSTVQRDPWRRSTVQGKPDPGHEVQAYLSRTPEQSGLPRQNNARARPATTVRAGPAVNQWQ